MIDDDPEKRIAELERQLAEAKAAARGQQFVEQPAGHDDADDRARRHAQALWDGLRTGAPTGPDGPSGPDIAQLREALMRAAADAGMSQAQINDVLQNGRVTIKTGHSVVYSGQGGPQDYAAPAGVVSQSAFPGTGFGRQTGVGYQAQRRKLVGADRFGAIVGVIGLVLGVCVGGAAALTALVPSSALWMSGLVCRSPYHLVPSTSNYSYKPGQSGTSVTFQCVGDTGSYELNTYALMGIQSLAALVVLFGVGAVVVLLRRGFPTRTIN